MGFFLLFFFWKQKAVSYSHIRMDSYRKRQHNAHIKEELIDKSQKGDTSEPKEKDDASMSASTKRRVDSIVEDFTEDNVDVAFPSHSVEYRHSSR